ncbi:MAG: sugar MFS transporter [Pseudomonadota bacterium]
MTHSGAPAVGGQSVKGAGWLVPFVVMLFFAWGFATVLIDTLIPKLKGLFSLSYAEVMLTQFSFFLAYLVFSVPAGILLSRIGYVRGIVTGLVVMAAGCLMFAPAARLGVYPGFLAALFIMAAGITLLQVAANPLMALLGRPESSHSRLNLAQAFNSLGTTVGPFVGSALILAGGVASPDPARLSPEALAIARRAEAHSVQLPFLGIAAGLVVLATIFWLVRRSARFPSADKPASLASALGLLASPHIAFGALSIFLYVGAEVSIGSLMTNYLMQEHTLSLAAVEAGKLVSLYWGGAMVGRFIGSLVLRKVRAGTALAFCAFMAAALATLSGLSTGMMAAAAIVAIGLFNSIMFPTIFTVTIEGRGDDTPQVSSLLCMAIVGGAVVPVITGALADNVGLGLALLAPVVCYVLIALFGLASRRRAGKMIDAPISPPAGG